MLGCTVELFLCGTYGTIPAQPAGKEELRRAKLRGDDGGSGKVKPGHGNWEGVTV